MPKSVKDMVAEANAVLDCISAKDARALLGRDDVVFVDLRDVRELQREGMIPGAYHCPRGMLEFWIDRDSPYSKSLFGEDRHFVFYCQSGWRSALGARTAKEMGLARVSHISDGFRAWAEAGSDVAEAPAPRAQRKN